VEEMIYTNSENIREIPENNPEMLRKVLENEEYR
jgi:hypothetical protein